MVQYSHHNLSDTFGALSDATRRGILDQLSQTDSSISTLASRFNMTLTGIKKHVLVLETAGLISTSKVGRIRTCELNPTGLAEAASWMDGHRKLWTERFRELDNVVNELNRMGKTSEQ